jgi:hypothetical protein
MMTLISKEQLIKWQNTMHDCAAFLGYQVLSNICNEMQDAIEDCDMVNHVLSEELLQIEPCGQAIVECLPDKLKLLFADNADDFMVFAKAVGKLYRS